MPLRKMQPNPNKPTIISTAHYSINFGVTFRHWKLYIPGKEPQRYETWREALWGCARHYHGERLEREIFERGCEPIRRWLETGVIA